VHVRNALHQLFWQLRRHDDEQRELRRVRDHVRRAIDMSGWRVPVACGCESDGSGSCAQRFALEPERAKEGRRQPEMAILSAIHLRSDFFSGPSGDNPSQRDSTLGIRCAGTP
jgi:hypothetical protein